MIKIVMVVVGLLVLAALLKPVLKILRQAVIRALQGILAGLAVGFGVNVVAGMFVDEPMMATGLGTMVGLIVAPITFLYLFWRDGRDAVSAIEAVAAAPPPPRASSPAGPPPPAPDPDPEPAADTAVREAWNTALALAPRTESPRLACARKACAGLLERFDRGDRALDPQAIDHVHLIRERLPALVRSVEAEIRNASPDYRTRVLRRMVEHLLDFGALAEARLTAATARSSDEWAVLDAHLANRLRGEGAAIDDV